MSEESRRHPLALKGVVYDLPGVDAVTVRRDVPYRAGDDDATLDVYAPPGDGSSAPAVVFVLGYSDAGAKHMLGCRFKEMESFASWARLVAASGMVAVTYTTGADPAADARDVLAYVRREAGALGVDADRIGVWSCSGHVPTALSVVTREAGSYLRCAALCYGFMLDVDGSTLVAEASAAIRFANPGRGRSVDDLPPDVPLLVVRAGADTTPGLNEAMDRFVAGALRSNLPITLTNLPGAPHAFDLMDDSEPSREAIAQILGFLRTRLLA